MAVSDRSSISFVKVAMVTVAAAMLVTSGLVAMAPAQAAKGKAVASFFSSKEPLKQPLRKMTMPC